MAGGAPGAAVAVVACGAIARHVADVAGRRRWPVDVHPLPPLLHNRPERIAAEVEEAVTGCDAGTRGSRWATPIAAPTARWTRSAPGWTYAAARRPLLRRLRGRRTLRRAARRRARHLRLTDYLATSFTRSVVVELGLDRYPELRDAYFGHYRRVVWLAQHPTAPPGGGGTSRRAMACRWRRWWSATRSSRARSRSWSRTRSQGRWPMPHPPADLGGGGQQLGDHLPDPLARRAGRTAPTPTPPRPPARTGRTPARRPR